MIKKFLLTSAALLSVTGAWAAVNDVITKNGINFTVLTENATEPVQVGTPTYTYVVTNGIEANVNGTITCNWIGTINNSRTITKTLSVKSLSEYSGSTANFIIENDNNVGKPESTNAGYTTYKGDQGFNELLAAIKRDNSDIKTASEVNNILNLPTDWVKNYEYGSYTDGPNTITGWHSAWNHATNSNSYYVSDGNYYNEIYSVTLVDTRSTVLTDVNVYQVTTIPENTFNGNTSTTSVNLSRYVSSIAETAFAGATNLSGISVESNNSNFTSENNILYNKTKTQVVAVGCDVASTTLTGVTSVRNYAFNNLKVATNFYTSKDIAQGTGNNKATFVYVPASLYTIPCSHGGFKVTGNVNSSNISSITFEGTYILFTGQVSEDLKITNNTKTLLFFTSDKKITGNNVINNDTCSLITITDAVPFYSPKAFYAKKAIYNRNIKDTWSTVCLPFKADGNTVTSSFKTGTLDGYDPDTYTFTFKYNDYIKAYTPTIVKNTSGSTNLTVTGQIEFPATANADTVTTVNGASFNGRIESPIVLTYTPNSKYYFGFSNNKLTKLNGTTVNPFRCYLYAPYNGSVAAAPSVRLVDVMDNLIEEIEGEATDINSIEVAEKNNSIYNLNGQRVNKMNTPGVYSVNGKKIIVK